MRYTATAAVAILALGCMGALSAWGGEAKVTPKTAVGTIQSVNAQAKSFVLGGKNESQTTFSAAVKAGTNREGARIMLDGKDSTFAEAVQAGRAATVTYVEVAADDLWVWKVAVSSAK